LRQPKATRPVHSYTTLYGRQQKPHPQTGTVDNTCGFWTLIEAVRFQCRCELPAQGIVSVKDILANLYEEFRNSKKGGLSAEMLRLWLLPLKPCIDHQYPDDEIVSATADHWIRGLLTVEVLQLARRTHEFENVIIYTTTSMSNGRSSTSSGPSTSTAAAAEQPPKTLEADKILEEVSSPYLPF
jgi:hypothetical protein